MKRIKYSVSDELELTTQVNGRCPLCNKPLYYKKNERSHKGYELAHIYPLNPTEAEAALLKDEPLLNDNVNHLDNLIPLSKDCHGKYDKPRTVEEYRQLYQIKRELIARSRQLDLQSTYPLEADIQSIITALNDAPDNSMSDILGYDPKKVDGKLTSSTPNLLRRKIKDNVASYFTYVRSRFLELERERSNSSELIFIQVKSFYIQQKKLALSQEQMFTNVVEWVVAKSQTSSL